MHSPGGSAVFDLVARLAGAVLATAVLLFLVARAGLRLGERPSWAVGSRLRLRVWRVVLAGCGGSSTTLDGLAMMPRQLCDIDSEGYERDKWVAAVAAVTVREVRCCCCCEQAASLG